jgi:hypothetical protein
METFILLQRELADNVDCLFVFVEHPEVEPTNNRSERNARCEAEIRKGALTRTTDRGRKTPEHHRDSFGKSSNSPQQVDIVEHAGGSWPMGGYRQVTLRT